MPISSFPIPPTPPYPCHPSFPPKADVTLWKKVFAPRLERTDSLLGDRTMCPLEECESTSLRRLRLHPYPLEVLSR